MGPAKRCLRNLVSIKEASNPLSFAPRQNFVLMPLSHWGKLDTPVFKILASRRGIFVEKQFLRRIPDAWPYNHSAARFLTPIKSFFEQPDYVIRRSGGRLTRNQLEVHRVEARHIQNRNLPKPNDWLVSDKDRLREEDTAQGIPVVNRQAVVRVFSFGCESFSGGHVKDDVIAKRQRKGRNSSVRQILSWRVIHRQDTPEKLCGLPALINTGFQRTRGQSPPSPPCLFPLEQPSPGVVLQ